MSAEDSKTRKTTYMSRIVRTMSLQLQDDLYFMVMGGNNIACYFVIVPVHKNITRTIIFTMYANGILVLLKINQMIIFPLSYSICYQPRAITYNNIIITVKDLITVLFTRYVVPISQIAIEQLEIYLL